MVIILSIKRSGEILKQELEVHIFQMNSLSRSGATFAHQTTCWFGKWIEILNASETCDTDMPVEFHP